MGRNAANHQGISYCHPVTHTTFPDIKYSDFCISPDISLTILEFPDFSSFLGFPEGGNPVLIHENLIHIDLQP